MSSEVPPQPRMRRTILSPLVILSVLVWLQVAGSFWTPAHAGGKMVRLVVLDFALNLDMANADDAAADQLPATLASTYMRTQASRSSVYTLVETTAVTSVGDVRDALCVDHTCASRIGHRLGAQRVIWGQVTKISALIWYVSTHLIDVATATSLHGETVQFRGNVTEVMPQVMAILWRRMHEATSDTASR